MVFAEQEGFQLTDKTVGIVGVGNVGGDWQTLTRIRCECTTCDPPRADRGMMNNFIL